MSYPPEAILLKFRVNSLDKNITDLFEKYAWTWLLTIHKFHIFPSNAEAGKARADTQEEAQTGEFFGHITLNLLPVYR